LKCAFYCFGKYETQLADKVKWEHKEYKEGSKAQEAWDLVFLPWHESSGCYAASLEKYFS